MSKFLFCAFSSGTSLDGSSAPENLFSHLHIGLLDLTEKVVIVLSYGGSSLWTGVLSSNTIFTYFPRLLNKSLVVLWKTLFSIKTASA